MSPKHPRRRRCPVLERDTRVALSAVFAIALPLLAAALGTSGCGDPEEPPAGMTDGETTDSGSTDDRGGDDDVIEVPGAVGSLYTSASTDGYLRLMPPVCEVGEWVDYDCDAYLPYDCRAGGEVLAYSDTDDSPCAVCVPDDDRHPTTCQGWSQRYGDTLSNVAGGSCANWCERDDDCFGFELANRCGTYAIALFGAIDEEIIEVAREFAADNCSRECGPKASAGFLRRAGSSDIEPFSDGQGQARLLPYFAPVCRDNMCVLERLDGPE